MGISLNEFWPIFLSGSLTTSSKQRLTTKEDTMAALHTLFAIFLAFGLVQLGNAYGTEAPERLKCYDDDFNIIHCEHACMTTQQEWEGEWLPAEERGCADWNPNTIPSCMEDPGGKHCYCNEPLCNNSIKNKSWWITLAVAFCLFKLFV